MPTLTDVADQRMIDEAILEHEKIILDHKMAILALNTRRNTHSAIFKLPTEIMAKIFLQVKRRCGYAEGSRYSQGSRDSVPYLRLAKEWLKVSGVCRGWRDMALGTPELWCTIDLSWQAQCALEFIRRCKSFPLQVQCKPHDYNSARVEPVVNAVMSQLDHVHELNIGVRNLDSLKHFLKLNPTGSAPSLKVLKLALVQNDASVLLPALWHDMQALRILDLKAILPSELPVLPQLTRLSMEYSARSSALPSASWLLRSLRNTPAIEEIDIVMLESFSSEMPTSPPVLLPKLTSLCIHTSDLAASKIFDHVEYPGSARVEFTCGGYRDTEADISGLHLACSRFTEGGRAAEKAWIGVIANRFQVRLGPSDAESLPQLKLELPMSTAMKPIHLCSTLPLETVHKLALSKFDSKIADWLSLFSRFQQVTTLCLVHCSGEMLTILANLQNPPFEKLETLIMNACVFNEYSGAKRQRKAAICDPMINLLRVRKEHGIPIRKLRVEGCFISPDEIKEFQAHVELDWDGLEHCVWATW